MKFGTLLELSPELCVLRPGMAYSSIGLPPNENDGVLKQTQNVDIAEVEVEIEPDGIISDIVQIGRTSAQPSSGFSL